MSTYETLPDTVRGVDYTTDVNVEVRVSRDLLDDTGRVRLDLVPLGDDAADSIVLEGDAAVALADTILEATTRRPERSRTFHVARAAGSRFLPAEDRHAD